MRIEARCVSSEAYKSHTNLPIVFLLLKHHFGSIVQYEDQKTACSARSQYCVRALSNWVRKQYLTHIASSPQPISINIHLSYSTGRREGP